MTRDAYKEYLIDHVIPCILAKWPGRSPRIVKVKQDNARFDHSVGKAGIVRAGNSVRLVCQTPNYTEFNILDLECFREIQSLYCKMAVKTVQYLVDATNAAFEA